MLHETEEVEHLLRPGETEQRGYFRRRAFSYDPEARDVGKGDGINGVHRLGHGRRFIVGGVENDLYRYYSYDVWVCGGIHLEKSKRESY